jgi:hypothetical protein
MRVNTRPEIAGYTTEITLLGSAAGQQTGWITFYSQNGQIVAN